MIAAQQNQEAGLISLNALGRRLRGLNVSARKPRRPGFALPGLEAAVVAALLLVATISAPGGVSASVPAQFSDALVASVPSPTDFTFLPDGRPLIASQGGVLYVVNGSTSTSILDLSGKICSDFERGMLGVAVDQSFASNRFIYIYYTFNKSNACSSNKADSPVNRVSRFVATPSGTSLSVASEVVLLDNMPSPNGNHNAGHIGFGKDGNLYVAIGDGGCDLIDSSKCGGNNNNA
ncbi:MAG: PQQ-dependent sugar dehydrogenase, partial [Thermomicrobiales bacterium]